MGDVREHWAYWLGRAKALKSTGAAGKLNELAADLKRSSELESQQLQAFQKFREAIVEAADEYEAGLRASGVVGPRIAPNMPDGADRDKWFRITFQGPTAHSLTFRREKGDVRVLNGIAGNEQQPGKAYPLSTPDGIARSIFSDFVEKL